MPGFDGTGPMGMGPMTGRGMGYCAMPLPLYGQFPLPYGYAGFARVPINNFIPPVAYTPYMFPRPFVSFWRGRGFGRGFGMGRGRRCWFPGYWLY